MADPLEKVRPGAKLRIPAKAYNAFVDAARYVQQHQRGNQASATPAARSSGIITVKNASGGDVDRFGVLGIDQPIFTPDTALDAFQDRVALVGVTPQQQHFGRFVILMEPIRNGEIGRAWAGGVCPVKLNIPKDGKEWRFADITDNSSATLTAAVQGAAFILWKEDPGSSGDVWGVVRLVAPPFRFYALDDCQDEKPTLYVTNDLAEQVGEVVRVDDTCYTVRVPDPGEITCLEPHCVQIKQEYEDCERCKGCWQLTPCDESDTPLKTNTDLAEHEGKVVRLDDGQCYQVSLAEDCLDAQPVEVVESYEDCNSCGHCYHLTNCFDETDTLVIDNDLAREFEESPEDIVANARTVEINGQCYSVVGYDTDCPDVQTVEITRYFPSCGDCGCFKLTVCNSDPAEIIYASKATDTNGGNAALRDHVGKVIRLNDGKCYSVEGSGDCEDLQEVVVQEVYKDCDACTCWVLTDCEDEAVTIVTFSDLSPYGMGAIVKEKGTGKCYTITDTSDWNTEAVAFETDSDYPDCDACLGNRLYTLTQSCSSGDCDDGGDGSGKQIVTNEDLHAAVGQFVKVDGKCYSVAEGGGEVTAESLEYQGPFASCDDCLDAAVDTNLRVLTDLFTDGNTLKASTQTLVIKGGLIVGICDSDDISVEGTDCPEAGGGE